ncbi:MAG: ATP-binding cassette domain-containing protein [Ilumatobacteraceae bacterium]
MDWQSVMMLSLHGHVSLGTFTLNANVEADNEVLGVVGPNGIGKTTMLRVIAGLIALDDGLLVVNGEIYDDAVNGVFVPPHERHVGMVFQDHLLLPFLNTVDNVAFPLRCTGVRKSAARNSARQALEVNGVSHLAELFPDHLSGGQSQRVSLVRALIVRPRMVLLDEPLSALDEQARPEVRRKLRESLVAINGPKIVVSHDRVDIDDLCDRVITL